MRYLMAVLFISAGITQVASLISLSHAQGPTAEDIRNEGKVIALQDRVKNLENDIEKADLCVRVALLESALKDIKKEREEGKKLDYGIVGGILTLLINAGYQFRISVKKGKKEEEA